jgi:CRP-like cAMP-binding protein
MELWQLHLVMLFSCLLTIFIAAAAIRKYFLSRRHLDSEFKGPHRKGDGPITRPVKNDDSATIIAVEDKFAASASQLAASEVRVSPLSHPDELPASDADESERITVLRCFPQLAAVDEAELRRVASRLLLVCVAAGDAIFIAGSAATTAYYIKDGIVEVSGAFSSVSDGDVRRLSSGDVFGLAALEIAAPHSTSAVAVSMCRLWALVREEVAALLPALQHAGDRSTFHNVSLKSAAAAALFASSIGGRAASQPAVQLHGASSAAPSLVPQQQTPSALLCNVSPPSPVFMPGGHAPSTASQDNPAPPSAAAKTSRLPKSLLRKHAALFDSESRAL